MKKILIILFIFILPSLVIAQNTAITDDDAYTANSSAMLDVKSLTKGLLIPRMTTSQRIAIGSPANSLLVYDTDLSAFYFWKGTSWTKIGTSENDYWLPDGANIYFTAGNVGVGTSSPGRKMIVKGSSTSLNEAIFAVQNTDGDTVFAVYPEGVRVWVNDDGGSKASGNRGGFAVGGYSPSKAGFTNEYLRVTPDSVRVYIDDDYTGSKASGNRGGFAVGGFSPSKGSVTDDYFFVQDDSTRVYVADSTEGFGVENIESVNNSRIMKLTTENYLIGHESGVHLTGYYNSFYGYKTAPNATTSSNNVLIGYKAGTSMTTSNENVFIGYLAGKSNTSGARNVFIGSNAGYAETTGSANVYIGPDAGLNSNAALYNIFIGSSAGKTNITGYSNSFVGYASGYYNNSGYSNSVFGSNALLNNSVGFYNSVFGAGAAQYSKGNSNCVFGYRAGYGASSSTYTNNVLIGTYSGSQLTTGNENVMLGYYTGYSCLTGEGNVFVGHKAGYNETGSDKLYIENSDASYSTSLIYGDFATDMLRFNANVGVGISPSVKFDVAGNATGVVAKFFNDGNNFDRHGIAIHAGADAQAGDHWFVRCYTGNGTLAGSIRSNNGLMSFVDASDIRLKKNISTSSFNATELLKNLRVVDFQYNSFTDSDGYVTGYIAQEVESILPKMVSTDPESGYLGVSTVYLIPVLHKAIQEQQKTIEGLQEQINKLEQQNSVLKENSASIEELTKQINYLKSVIDMQTKK